MATCNCKRPAAAANSPAAGAICRSRKRIRRVVGTASDYRRESRLGEGMFGAVFKARHRATGQPVAVKTLCNPDHEDEADEAHALLREARFLEACAAGGTGHPSIVGFRGFLRDGLTHELSLAMDYVPGQSLHRLLHSPSSAAQKKAGLPEDTVRAFMWQLLSGAKRIHTCHVVHRDLKPANVIVGEGGGSVKICDFGVALSLQEPPPYDADGTGLYRAPEMLLGKTDYDALVDTWSLWCVMAEMITGERLFHGTEEISLLKRIFQVVGVPDDATWPEFASLPLAARVAQVPAEEQKSTLRDLFTEETLSKEGFEVLNGLLACNPDKRFTAAATLKLPWFAVTAAAANAYSPSPAAAAAMITMTVSIKEEEVESVEIAVAPSTLRKTRIVAKRSVPNKKALLL